MTSDAELEQLDKWVKGVGKRHFLCFIENGLGDHAAVPVLIHADRDPKFYHLVAINQARRVLPDVKPWKITGWEEIS